MGRPTKIVIHLDALENNFNQIKKLAPHSSILAMVKSNAYGHGLERIAQALTKADAFGVACIEEGVALRKAGIKKPIVLLEGLFNAQELADAVALDFTLVIHHLYQIKMLEKSHLLKPLSIWMKIDTGMHRLGFAPHIFINMYERLTKIPGIKNPIGLMTHFAEADAIAKLRTQEQIDLFLRLTKDLPGPRSLSNSAGIIAWPQAHADWVRPGIMLYGASPFKGQPAENYHLRPVMSLNSQIIAIKELKTGDLVGYGGAWQCQKPMRIGVVAVGYGDGYPQFAKNNTPVLVNQSLCSLVGRVSMDMLTVDLNTTPEAKIGDPVLLWGEGLPVEVIAENNNTSPYELLTRMMQRVPVRMF